VFNLQGSEIIVILLLALVVLGPEKLPDAVRRFTRTYAELKKMGAGFQSELKSALDEPMREMRETANLIRDAADPEKIAAEAEAERRLQAETEAAEARAAQVPGDSDVDPGGHIDVHPGDDIDVDPSDDIDVDPGDDIDVDPGDDIDEAATA
jgi:sec-independent protein translocase protein TatB